MCAENRCYKQGHAMERFLSQYISCLIKFRTFRDLFWKETSDVKRGPLTILNKCLTWASRLCVYLYCLQKLRLLVEIYFEFFIFATTCFEFLSKRMTNLSFRYGEFFLSNLSIYWLTAQLYIPLTYVPFTMIRGCSFLHKKRGRNVGRSCNRLLFDQQDNINKH